MQCPTSDFEHKTVKQLCKLADDWMDYVCDWSENEPVAINVPDDKLIDYHNYAVTLLETLRQRISTGYSRYAIIPELTDALEFTNTVIGWMREEEAEKNEPKMTCIIC